MIAFLVRLVRILGILLLVRLVLRAVAAWARGPRPAPGPPGATPTDLVRDRICNTFLPRERALRSLVAGREEHFCSAACRDRALAAAVRAS